MEFTSSRCRCTMMYHWSPLIQELQRHKEEADRQSAIYQDAEIQLLWLGLELRSPSHSQGFLVLRSFGVNPKKEFRDVGAQHWHLQWHWRFQIFVTFHRFLRVEHSHQIALMSSWPSMEIIHFESFWYENGDFPLPRCIWVRLTMCYTLTLPYLNIFDRDND